VSCRFSIGSTGPALPEKQGQSYVKKSDGAERCGSDRDCSYEGVGGASRSVAAVTNLGEKCGLAVLKLVANTSNRCDKAPGTTQLLAD
jgi:hypothetical protein